ncbi:midas domain-containing protein [Bifidobacterium choloepi]|uniref:Helicase n=1 Tax=Bifidobacterium choloepi TaxID=2614131 RepID=A0A6I5N1A1_9BIFI|nr:helicase [Bifidobacterium choloepi]NEG70246.1 helicase [Bifidobacterium choloepi]
MAEESGRHGNGNGGRRSYGNGHGGSGRGNGGYRGRGNGGRKFGGNRNGSGRGGNFHRNGGGFKRNNGQRRDERGDSASEDGEGGQRRSYGNRPYGNRGNRDFSNGGRGGNRRYGNGNGRGGYGHGGPRRHDDRDFNRDDRRDGGRDYNRGDRDRRDERGNRSYGGHSNGGNRHYNDHGNGGYRGGKGGGRSDRRDDRRNDRRNEHGDRPQRREFTSEEKQQYREQKRHEYMSHSRRNSDGTVSFPSQNPYTDRRQGEPKMPAGLEWSMLSKDERERLRGLSKEHAENIGLHILAAFTLEESDPDWALAHAKWAAQQASRIDFTRETLALVSYRQGDYKLALREFKTAYRMNGYLDYLPFIADCERGLGEPKKAIELAQSDDAKKLQGEAKVEMFLVYAGALADLEMWNQAIEIVSKLVHSKGLPGEYKMRALQAEQYFLEQSGRSDEAVALDEMLDKFEDQFADVEPDENDDTFVVDYDVEDLPEDLQAKLGVTKDDAQYAPFDNESGVNMDDETRNDEEEQLAGAELDEEPAKMAEDNDEMDEEGTMGDPDLSDEDDIRQEAEVGDVEEQIKEELE